MFSYLRSAVGPLLLTMGLSLFMVMGVHDLARQTHAACAHRLPAPASATQVRPVTETHTGIIHLSRFNPSELFRC